MPVNDRFTATILDEASKTTNDEEHLDMIDSMVGGIVAGEMDEDDVPEEQESELEELVDYDGSIMTSKIPMGNQTNQTIGASKTSDDIVRATSQYGVWDKWG